ncbi:MAG: C13 family peptidase [Burkholderiales bacterium]
MGANLLSGLRLALFLDAPAGRFLVSAGQLCALAMLGLLLNFFGSMLLVGSEGFFNFQALPSALFGVLALLFAGLLMARCLKDNRYTLLIPVAMASIGITIGVAAYLFYFALAQKWFQMPADLEPYFSYYVVFGWWTLASLLTVARLVPWVPGVGLLPVFIFVLTVLVPESFLPSERLWEPAVSEDPAGSEAAARWYAAVTEKSLYAQPDLLASALTNIAAERPGIDDLYFVGFAPYASQDVFMKEARAVEQMLQERFDTAGRSVSLINHASLAEQTPLASLTSLRKALRAVGGRINSEEDIVLLHVTTHGSEDHQLSVEFWPLKLDPIGPAELRAALDDAGIKWRIVVVSACYAGGFIDALKNDNTLVVAAAESTKQSFGCGNEFNFTYFSKAYFDEALRNTHSFSEAFDMAKSAIRLRETKEGIAESNPQSQVGEAMVAKLARLRERLDAAEVK